MNKYLNAFNNSARTLKVELSKVHKAKGVLMLHKERIAAGAIDRVCIKSSIAVISIRKLAAKEAAPLKPERKPEPKRDNAATGPSIKHKIIRSAWYLTVRVGQGLTEIVRGPFLSKKDAVTYLKVARQSIAGNAKAWCLRQGEVLQKSAFSPAYVLPKFIGLHNRFLTHLPVTQKEICGKKLFVFGKSLIIQKLVSLPGPFPYQGDILFAVTAEGFNFELRGIRKRTDKNPSHYFFIPA